MAERDSVLKIDNLLLLLVLWLLAAPGVFSAQNTELNLGLERLNLGITEYSSDFAHSSHQSKLNDYMSLYNSNSQITLESEKQYLLGIVRFKADRTMRVRGWEVRNNLYFGQAKVGKKWGVGLIYDRGTHYYGLNNRGISFLKKF